ncbi:MAG: ribonuclease R [Fidelibacterota bacterium]|nr:MAG: ribonuclease R [Candidatus Neomarinimicrobiota bacterium]
MIREEILAFLQSKPGRAYRRKDLARRLRIKADEYPTFRRLIGRMIREGILTQVRGGRLAYTGPIQEVTGILEMTRRGFGFVLVEAMDDVFVEARDLGGATSGDRVRIALRKQTFGRGPKGRVLEVIQRGRSTLVGTIDKVAGGYELMLSEPFANRAVRLRSDKIRKEDVGALVHARVTDWGTEYEPILAEIEEIIGSPEDPLTDYKLVLRQFNLEPEFPREVDQEVARLVKKISIEPGPDRRDLRTLRVVTIDPVTAKDFDDAISLERQQDGKWELGIHIADVSLFVPRDSTTDAEARRRGNSVYFTEGTVPMLPHILSSDLCSLKPERDRLTISAMITLTDEAYVEEVRFTRSLIQSKRRFTYTEVQEILDNDVDEWHVFFADLRNLTRRLYEKRVEQGSVDFDIPEPLFKLDDYGVPHMIHPSQRLDSHRIVEECMLLANRLVAERIPKGKPGRKFLYRIHDEPGQDQIVQLSALLRRLNLPGLPSRDVTSKEVRDLLLAVENSPYRDLIETITLRSMAKAVYSASNRGHFGLAFPFYTHFTSPIRRYADLVVHHLLVEHLTAPKAPWTMSEEVLDEVARQCTQREIEALEAERAYSRLKELRFLATQIGNIFEGIISGVSPKGFFVQIREFLVDGFVSIEWLEGDDYFYDESLFAIQGRRFHDIYQLGKEVQIIVRDVSIERRFANFQVVDS